MLARLSEPKIQAICPMTKDQRQRLRDACKDGDKVFTAEIVLMLLDALDEAERSGQLKGETPDD
jgi:hypothetical protein